METVCGDAETGAELYISSCPKMMRNGACCERLSVSILGCSRRQALRLLLSRQGRSVMGSDTWELLELLLGLFDVVESPLGDIFSYDHRLASSWMTEVSYFDI